LSRDAPLLAREPLRYIEARFDLKLLRFDYEHNHQQATSD
jgi:hypothetical protein